MSGCHAKKKIDDLVIGAPDNNWHTGYYAWPFYTPNIIALGHELDPPWIDGEIDAGAAAFKTYFNAGQVIPFPESYV